MNPARTDAHPSAEEVDATLDPTGAAPDVVEHVSRCPRCSRMRDGLVEVRVLLRQESQRVHEPPADLGARIAAALGAAPASDETRRRRRPAGGWFALAAGLAVVAGSAAVAVQVVSSGEQDVTAAVEDSSSSAAESAEGAGPSADADSDSGGGADTRASVPQLLDAAVPAVGTGTDYRREDLTTQVTALLSPRPAAAAVPEGDVSLNDPGALKGCLTSIGAGSGSGSGVAEPVPVAVDLAEWEGRDAAILVLRDPAEPAGRTVDVWVVSRTCGPADDTVLHFARVES